MNIFLTIMHKEHMTLVLVTKIIKRDFTTYKNIIKNINKNYICDFFRNTYLIFCINYMDDNFIKIFTHVTITKTHSCIDGTEYNYVCQLLKIIIIIN